MTRGLTPRGYFIDSGETFNDRRDYQQAIIARAHNEMFQDIVRHSLGDLAAQEVLAHNNAGQESGNVYSDDATGDKQIPHTDFHQ